MFFSADREFRRLKRRISEELPGSLSVSPDMKVSIGDSGFPWAKQAHFRMSAYPEFADLTLSEIRAMGDPMSPEESAPVNKKARVMRAAEPISSQDTVIVAVPRRKSVVCTWEDLVELSPEFGDILREQQAKIDKSRLPLEFVQPSKPVLSSLPEPVVKSDAFPVPVPEKPVSEGMLAGIDEMFGSTSKSSKYKSKRGR